MGKRELILEAAEKLFAENGFDGTSVREIAAGAGVNIAMINYYFGSKEKLMEALVDYRASYLRERFSDLQKEPLHPQLKIDKVIDLLVDRIFSQRRFHRILHRQMSLQNRSEMNTIIMSIILKNADIIRDILQEGIEKRVFKEIDAEMFIASLFGTISQVNLSTIFCSTMILRQPEIADPYSDELKKRVQEYLKNMSSRYLNTQSS